MHACKASPKENRDIPPLDCGRVYRPKSQNRNHFSGIDRVYPLEDAGQAHAYVDTGRKRGSVVLIVSAENAIRLAA